MLNWLRKLLAPKWVHRKANGEWEVAPKQTGLYRVMISGDSESVDGFTVYAFDDYEAWANFKFTPADERDEDDLENTGTFQGEHDEEDFTIFAYCGPFFVREYKRD